MKKELAFRVSDTNLLCVPIQNSQSYSQWKMSYCFCYFLSGDRCKTSADLSTVQATKRLREKVPAAHALNAPAFQAVPQSPLHATELPCCPCISKESVTRSGQQQYLKPKLNSSDKRCLLATLCSSNPALHFALH